MCKVFPEEPDVQRVCVRALDQLRKETCREKGDVQGSGKLVAL